MKIIIENLDVQNLFKAVYKREEIKDPIEMSEECKSNLVYNIKQRLNLIQFYILHFYKISSIPLNLISIFKL